MRFNSIRFKASVLYSITLAVILILFSSVIYYSIRNILYNDLDKTLKIKAEELATILYTYNQIERSGNYPLNHMLDILRSKAGVKSEKAVINDIWKAQFKVLDLKNDYINVLNIQRRSLLISNNFTQDISSLFRKQCPFSLKNVIYKTLSNEEIRLRAINLPITYYHSQLVIQVGTPLDHVIQILNKTLLFIIITAIILLVLTSFIGSIFARSILKPVTAVVNLADNITHKDLTARIKGQQIDEEMKHLINSFNAMIDRLEQSFSHISEFSSHVAHELKTPLAIMKGEIELTLGQDRDVKEYNRVLLGCHEEIGKMIRIINDLLLLARLDYRPDVFKFEKIDLVQFLGEIYEHSKVLASSKDIEIKLNTPARNVFINGDKIHLQRLFFNLINNALKFTPEKGEIDISMDIRNSNVYIDITDTGEGIAEENLPKIFDKFFHTYSGKEDSESGTGLGLNIALSIARAHKGDIKVKSQLHQGATFTVILPLA